MKTTLTLLSILSLPMLALAGNHGYAPQMVAGNGCQGSYPQMFAPANAVQSTVRLSVPISLGIGMPQTAYSYSNVISPTLGAAPADQPCAACQQPQPAPAPQILNAPAPVSYQQQAPVLQQAQFYHQQQQAPVLQHHQRYSYHQQQLGFRANVIHQSQLADSMAYQSQAALGAPAPVQAPVVVNVNARIHAGVYHQHQIQAQALGKIHHGHKHH